MSGRVYDPAAAAQALGHPFPLPADEPAGLTEMRQREIDALIRGYTDGDVNHEIQPVIGHLRLLASKDELPDADTLRSHVDRMWAACEAEHALLAERKAAARAAADAPLIAVIGNSTFNSERAPTGFDTIITTHVWNALRDATRLDLASAHPDAAPTGWLYDSTGPRKLDDVLAAMWSCPEAVALRDVPHGSEQYREPHLSTMEQSQVAMDRLWAEFRGITYRGDDDQGDQC